MPVSEGITTATVIKAVPGKVIGYSVIVAGSAAGTINDCATTGAAGSTNAVAVTPNAVGNFTFGTPIQCGTGIVVSPGSGQTIVLIWE